MIRDLATLLFIALATSGLAGCIAALAHLPTEAHMTAATIALPEGVDKARMREFRRIEEGRFDSPGERAARMARLETEIGRPALVLLRAAIALKKTARATGPSPEATP